MAYRPYPNIDRALRQLGRHDDEIGPAGDRQPRPLSPFTLKMTTEVSAGLQAFGSSLAASFAKMAPRDTRAATQDAPPVDEYRLSTRRPDVSSAT